MNRDRLNYNLINKFLAIFLPLISIYFLTIIIEAWNLIDIIRDFLNFLTPLFVAFIITWFLNPVVRFLCSKNISRLLSTIIAFVLFFFTIYLLSIIFIPAVGKQISELLTYLPQIEGKITSFVETTIDGIEDYISAYDLSSIDNLENIEKEIISKATNLVGYFSDSLKTLTTSFLEFFSSLLALISNIFFSIMLSFYILYDYDRIIDFIINIFPKKQQKTVSFFFNQFTVVLGNYFRSYTVISFIVTILSYIAFSLLGLSSPLVLALFVGIFNFIPIIGPFIGAVPALLVALSMGIGKAFICGVVITVIQQIDANILKPLLMGKSTNLHPIWIILSVMFFGKYFGIVGVLVAIPVTSIARIIILYIKDRYFR